MYDIYKQHTAIQYIFNIILNINADKYFILCFGDAAAYRVVSLAWRSVGRSVDLPARDKTYTPTNDMLLHHRNI